MSALLIGTLWFLSSSLISTWANTTFLKTFKDPLLHNFIRFAGSAILSLITMTISGKVKLTAVPDLVSKVMIPAFLLFAANYTNSIALDLAGITLTSVVKSSSPVLTVLLCSLGGQTYPWLMYVSLAPICIGVVIASGADIDFSIVGLSAALISTLAQTCMNLSAKQVRSKTGLSGPETFLGMSIFCTLLALPFAMAPAYELTKELTFYPANRPTAVASLTETLQQALSGEHFPLFLTALTSFGYYAEYLLTFIYVGLVSALAFSVTDIARRVSSIVIGSVVFKKKLTSTNWCVSYVLFLFIFTLYTIGIVIALSGVLWYSYLDQQQANKVKGTETQKVAAVTLAEAPEGKSNLTDVSGNIDKNDRGSQPTLK